MTLYLVGTPIGNLKDITLRALEVLRFVPVLLVESPSDSRPLLNAYDIHPQKIIKYNDANRHRVTPAILKILKTQDAALITSAGMPGVSDPAAELVRECRAQGILVVPIPGPSALTTAIAMSGFRGPFLFVGYFPRKKGELRRLIQEMQEKQVCVVAFESPFRIVKTLEAIREYAPAAQVFMGKEMTKKFETYVSGDANELLRRLRGNPDLLRGEFTFILRV